MVDTFSSLTNIVRAIREREVSASEVLEAHLARIDEVNPTLNAVVQMSAERARVEAAEADAAIARGDDLGPLHGAPITLKDSHDTEGIVTTGGTLGRKDFVPDADSTVAARLRAAGAILMGKTNTPELTLSGETDNLVYGQTRNPFNPERTPGGSSGGAAAMVSAGGSPLDMGSDTGGSIRLPSHFSGICGIKPTAGRVPRTGHIVPWGMGALDAWTTIGPMTRYVEDLMLALPIISGPDGVDPFIAPVPLRDPADVDLSSLRIAWYSDVEGYLEPDEDTRATLEAAVTALGERVASVEPDTPPALAEYVDLWPRVGGGDGRAWVQRMLDKWGTTEESPFLKQGFDTIEPTATDEFTKSLERQDQFRSEMLQFIQPYDAIVAPVAARPAPEHGQTYSKELRTMFYTGPVQHHGMAGHGAALWNIGRRSAYRHPDSGASLARGCHAGRGGGVGVGSRRLAAASDVAASQVAALRPVFVDLSEGPPSAPAQAGGRLSAASPARRPLQNPSTAPASERGAAPSLASYRRPYLSPVSGHPGPIRAAWALPKRVPARGGDGKLSYSRVSARGKAGRARSVHSTSNLQRSSRRWRREWVASSRMCSSRPSPAME